MVKDDVLLVAGNLTSVSVEVSELWKKDVIDSVLFSQLYASSKVGRFSDSQQWYKYYADAMTKAKWRTVGYRFSDLKFDEGISIVLNSLIQRRLGPVAGSPQADQFERLMCAIQKNSAAQEVASLTDDHSMVFKVVGKASTVSTVVLNVSLVARGPAMHSAIVCFKTTQDVEHDVFHQEFKSELVVGEIGSGVSQFVLDKDAYQKSRMREKILGSLPEVTAPLVLDMIAKDEDQLR